jgi:antitoxin component YwqK of YwqJK toxin-antitoxin module
VVDAFTNYFENGKIRDVLIYKDDKLEGKYSEYHPNGKLKSTGMYVNDKQTGLWMYYHPNGRLGSSGMYKQGVAVGPWSFYNERGGLFEKKHFNDEGKTDGDDIIYDNEKIHYINTYKNDVLIGVTYLDSAGRQLGKFGNPSGTFNSKQYYSTGQLSAEGSYKNGKMHGAWQYYFPEGSKQSIFNYEEGTLQGEATEYFRSGAKKYVFHYSDGKFNGKFEEYYSHGQLKHNGWFTAGERQQQWLSYFPNGVLESDFYYLHGEFSGLGLEYSTTGKLLSASNYESDRLNDLISYNASGNAITQRSGEAARVSYQAKYKTGKLQSSFETRCGDFTKITRWFPDGKVFYAYELLSGLKEGSYQYNAINGRTLLQGSYINGQEEGLWSGYHETGQLDYAGSYLAGKHDSTWVYYFPNGKISSRGEYRNGDRHGITIIYGADGTPLLQKFYVDGNLTGYREISHSAKSEWKPFKGDASIILTYPNGKKAYEENYKRGVLDGPKRIYYPDGNLYSEYNYVLGDYHGAYRLFYPGNKPMEKGVYELDELHGTIEKFNEDGSILLSEEYNMGLRNGKSVLYEKGQKKIEFEFYGGIPYE